VSKGCWYNGKWMATYVQTWGQGAHPCRAPQPAAVASGSAVAQGAGQTQAASNANAQSGVGGAAANNQAAAVGGGPAQAQVSAQPEATTRSTHACLQSCRRLRSVRTEDAPIHTFSSNTHHHQLTSDCCCNAMQGNANAQSGAGSVAANNNVVAAGGGAAIGQGSANAQVRRSDTARCFLGFDSPLQRFTIFPSLLALGIGGACRPPQHTRSHPPPEPAPHPLTRLACVCCLHPSFRPADRCRCCSGRLPDNRSPGQRRRRHRCCIRQGQRTGELATQVKDAAAVWTANTPQLVNILAPAATACPAQSLHHPALYSAATTDTPSLPALLSPPVLPCPASPQTGSGPAAASSGANAANANGPALAQSASNASGNQAQAGSSSNAVSNNGPAVATSSATANAAGK
jgi:hypothetical protein